MANTLICDIVAPDRMLYSGEAVVVSAPAADGDIGLMHQHSPLMTTLRRGLIRIKDENNDVTSYAVDGGYLEVDGSKVIILATRAINVEEIDKGISSDRIKVSEERIKHLDEANPAKVYETNEISWQNYLLSLV